MKIEKLRAASLQRAKSLTSVPAWQPNSGGGGVRAGAASAGMADVELAAKPNMVLDAAYAIPVLAATFQPAGQNTASAASGEGGRGEGQIEVGGPNVTR